MGCVAVVGGTLSLWTGWLAGCLYRLECAKGMVCGTDCWVRWEWWVGWWNGVRGVWAFFLLPAFERAVGRKGELVAWGFTVLSRLILCFLSCLFSCLLPCLLSCLLTSSLTLSQIFSYIFSHTIALVVDGQFEHRNNQETNLLRVGSWARRRGSCPLRIYNVSITDMDRRSGCCRDKRGLLGWRGQRLVGLDSRGAMASDTQTRCLGIVCEMECGGCVVTSVLSRVVSRI